MDAMNAFENFNSTQTFIIALFLPFTRELVRFRSLIWNIMTNIYFFYLKITKKH